MDYEESWKEFYARRKAEREEEMAKRAGRGFGRFFFYGSILTITYLLGRSSALKDLRKANFVTFL